MNAKRFFYVMVVVLLVLCMMPAAALARGPGGGGHEEPTTGNNLSFPVIWSEGVALPLAGTLLNASLTVPFDILENPCPVGALPYAQKTEGNVWQAENASITNTFVYVDEIDWGDSLESVDMKVNRPVRVELSLYKLLETPMIGYTMVMLANPSSPDEVQGVCATDSAEPNIDGVIDNGEYILFYDSYESTVYSPYAGLIIQKISSDTPTLTWDGDLNEWTGDVEAPLPVTFAGELNVGGKVIYGLSEGGWKPTEIGNYRITFFLPTDGNTLFDDNTSIRLGGEGGGNAVVDADDNLTYIDISVVGGGGGGGGGGKH